MLAPTTRGVQLSTKVSEVIHRFNHAFVAHDPTGFDALIGDGCVMEAIEPAPDGARDEGKQACVAEDSALADVVGDEPHQP